MNALSLYVTTCRMVLQSGADDATAWADISRLLSCLRQALTCCVCEKVLNTPMSSSDGNCQHCICQKCIDGKMHIKPACSTCADRTKFTENNQQRIILQCYKKLCEYIISSALHHKWGSLNGGTTNNLAELVQEGADIASDCNSSSSAKPSVNSSSLPSGSGASSPTENQTLETGAVNDGDDYSNAVSNGNGSLLYSVSRPDSSSTKIMIKRTTSEGTENEVSSHDEMDGFSIRDTNITVEMARSFRPKKKGCRCGLATPNPGKLTCCGQRCPCYVDGKACFQCRCRGCRNPNKNSSENSNSADSATVTSEKAQQIELEATNSHNSNSDIIV